MPRLDAQIFDDFSGGINKSTTADNIADNELAEALNVNIQLDKSLRTRQGISQYNSTLTGADKVTSIFYGKTTDSGSTDLLVTTLDKVYKDNGAGGWTDITGGTAPPSGTRWRWKVFNDLMIGVNGQTVPQKYAFTGTLADLTGSPPDNCHDIEVFLGRVILTNDDDEPTALHGSAAADPEDWTAVGDAFTIYIDKDNGYRVMKAVKFYSDLIILKEKGIYRLSPGDNDPANFTLVQLFDDIGCVSPHTVFQIGNELVWLDTDGVYTLGTTSKYGDVSYVAISKKIQEFVDDIDPAYIDESVAHDFRALNQLRISVTKSGSTENDHVLVRDYFHGGWTRHEGVNYACYGKAYISNGWFDLAGGYDGKVYKLDQLEADDSAAFEKHVKTKRFHLGGPHVRKLFHRTYHEFNMNSESHSVGYTADVQYGKITKSVSISTVPPGALWDDSTVGQRWDEGKWAGEGMGRKWVSVHRKGTNVQHQYYNNQASEKFVLYKHGIDASSLGRKG